MKINTKKSKISNNNNKLRKKIFRKSGKQKKIIIRII